MSTVRQIHSMISFVPDRFIEVNSGELVGQVVMFVGHVAVKAQVEVIAHGALPANTT